MPPVRYVEGAFPPEDRLDWSKLIPMIGPASAALARYDELLATIPGPDVLLAPLTTQEAVLSSRIEGTRATMGDVLGFEAGGRTISPDREADVREILNYRVAMAGAIADLADLPLCQRVVLSAHRVLLSGVRGAGKSPGTYRRVPNWIGPPGSSPEDATYVPIGADKLPAAMDARERYLHATVPDPLVQLAILHAEFEALHPFLDGNGRLGRMLVPLFLWQQGIIRQPVFYISAYLEERRDRYHESLLRVSREDDWTGWCQFFLDAVKTQAEDNRRKTEAVFNLFEETTRWFSAVTRSRGAIDALRWLFANPVFSSSDFVRTTRSSRRTSLRWIATLYDRGILSEIATSAGSRPRILAFPALLNIVEGRDVF
ncbi:Fic family protein [Candidatus Palauibacter sp.]|uniref:Fic family protein n=1 Tax=Candidatus Palauibacter sp. TaxID=3101350 RepID=UPI003B52B33D